MFAYWRMSDHMVEASCLKRILTGLLTFLANSSLFNPRVQSLSAQFHTIQHASQKVCLMRM